MKKSVQSCKKKSRIKLVICEKNVVNSSKLLHILKAIQMILDIEILSRKTFLFIYIFALLKLKLNYPSLSCLISYKILERLWGGTYIHCKRLINVANRQKILWKTKTHIRFLLKQEQIHSYFATKFRYKESRVKIQK